MPYVNGRLTPGERAIAKAYAEVPNQAYVAFKTGMSSGGISLALARPAVQDQVEKNLKQLLEEGSMKGAKLLSKVVDDEKVPMNLRIQAGTNLIKAHQNYDAGKGGEREPHEMSIDEIHAKLASLEHEASNRARLIEAPDSSVFE